MGQSMYLLHKEGMTQLFVSFSKVVKLCPTCSQ